MTVCGTYLDTDSNIRKQRRKCKLTGYLTILRSSENSSWNCTYEITSGTCFKVTVGWGIDGTRLAGSPCYSVEAGDGHAGFVRSFSLPLYILENLH